MQAYLRGEYVYQRELFEDGSIIEKEVADTPYTRKTYSSELVAYNASQTSEKETLQSLLHELCEIIPESTERNLGRPHFRFTMESSARA